MATRVVQMATRVVHMATRVVHMATKGGAYGYQGWCKRLPTKYFKIIEFIILTLINFNRQLRRKTRSL